jgi:hypothetical protein
LVYRVFQRLVPIRARVRLEERLHAGVVVRGIQATEGGHGVRDHRCHFSLVGDVAADGNRLIAGGDQFFCCRANRILIDIRQNHGSSDVREGSGRGQTHARGSSSNQPDLILEGPVHDLSPRHSFS